MSKYVDLAVLKRNPQYAKVFAGQSISFLGNMITMVSLPYQVYQLTNSNTMVGLLSLFQLVPLIFFALIGGVYADRHSRRYILLISEIILMCSGLILATNAYCKHPSIYLIFFFSALMSAVTGLHRPAFEGVIQQIVDSRDYKPVGALRTFQRSFGMVIGPAIAGFVIAYLGLTVTYLLDSASFFASSLAIYSLKKLPQPITKNFPPIWQSMKQGFSFAWNRQEILGSYAVDFFAMFFAIPNALFPAMAQSFGGVKTLGLLYASPAIGAVVMSFFSGWTANVRYEGRAIAISALLWGVSIIGFGTVNNLSWACFYLMLSGGFDACSGIFRSSLWNHSISSEFRGRLASLEMLSYTCGPKLGDTRAGISANYFGIAPAIQIGALLGIISVAYCCYRLPKFWHYQSD